MAKNVIFLPYTALLRTCLEYKNVKIMGKCQECNTVSESFRKQPDEKWLSRILLLQSRIERLEEGHDNRPLIN